MQNCPLEATQIASVMALNARNRKIYGAFAAPLGPPAEGAYSADE